MTNLGNKKIMSQNITKLMDERSIDRNKLADDLGISYTTISDWINAKTYPRIDKIEMMANYFGVSKADLVEDEPAIDSRTRLLAAHIDDDVTDEQMEEILNYIDYIKSKNK